MSAPTRRVLLAGLAAGCSALPPPGPLPEAAQPPVAAVDVVARDWHTDIGLPMEAVRGPLGGLARTFPGASHLLFGFGERAYWTRPGATPLHALLALLPGEGAILVTGLRVPPAEAFAAAQVVPIGVPRAGVDRVSDFLWEELAKDPGGRPRILADGPYAGSLFYATARRYSAAYTCNTWTAEALRMAGAPISPDGVVLASQLMRRARAAAG